MGDRRPAREPPGLVIPAVNAVLEGLARAEDAPGRCRSLQQPLWTSWSQGAEVDRAGGARAGAGFDGTIAARIAWTMSGSLMIPRDRSVPPQGQLRGSTKTYAKGRRISDREMADVRLGPDAFHGEWNDTIEHNRQHNLSA